MRKQSVVGLNRWVAVAEGRNVKQKKKKKREVRVAARVMGFLPLNPRFIYLIFFIGSWAQNVGLTISPKKKLSSSKASLKYIRLALLTFRSEELRVSAHHFLLSFPSGFFQLVIPP